MNRKFYYWLLIRSSESPHFGSFTVLTEKNVLVISFTATVSWMEPNQGSCSYVLHKIKRCCVVNVLRSGVYKVWCQVCVARAPGVCTPRKSLLMPKRSIYRGIINIINIIILYARSDTVEMWIKTLRSRDCPAKRLWFAGVLAGSVLWVLCVLLHKFIKFFLLFSNLCLSWNIGSFSVICPETVTSPACRGEIIL